MKKLLATNKGILLFYSLIIVSISLGCLFFLFINIYEVSAVLGISGFTTFFALVIMLYGNEKPNKDGVVKPGSFVGFSILRFICFALGMGLSAIMLYFTNDGADKMRLFYSALSIVPIVLAITLFSIKGKDE